MHVKVNVKGTEYAIDTDKLKPEVQQYIFEYGLKQSLADAAAGKAGKDATDKIAARFKGFQEGIVPDARREADAVLTAAIKILRTNARKGGYRVAALKDVKSRTDAKRFAEKHFGKGKGDALMARAEEVAKAIKGVSL